MRGKYQDVLLIITRHSCSEEEGFKICDKSDSSAAWTVERYSQTDLHQ